MKTDFVLTHTHSVFGPVMSTGKKPSPEHVICLMPSGVQKCLSEDMLEAFAPPAKITEDTKPKTPEKPGE